ncbi:unnamed protein product, partial [Closterium sp. NIES-53]
TRGKPHTEHRCFSRLDDAWRTEFGDEAERPCWAELLRYGVAIFDLDYEAIIAAMYALSVSAEGDCYLCVLPDPGIEAAALGSESALLGTVPAEVLHTLTFDSSASRCFFRDSTTLTPLSAPLPVRLADPSWGLVLACFSTFLPCLAVPSGLLSGLHLPSFSTNLVSIGALQDAMVTTTTPGGQRVSICTCTRTGRHHATFTRWPGSSLSTLAIEPPQVAASAQVSASGPVAPPCRTKLSCGTTALVTPPCHASVACTTASLFLVFPGLCLPSRSRLPRPAFLASRGGSAPLLTPPRFPRRLFPCRLSSWTCGAQHVVRSLMSSSLRSAQSESRSANGSAKTFLSCVCTLTEVQNGIVEQRIGLVMEVAHTSVIHAAAPHFLWPFAVRFPPDALGWQFYHPTSRRVLPSQDVTFVESVPFYRLFPYCSTPLPPPPLFLAPGPTLVDPLPPQGLAPSGATRGATRGAASGGAASWGAEPASVDPGGSELAGAEPEGEELGGAESEGAESRGAAPRGTVSAGGPAGASSRLSPRREPLSAA